MVVESGGTTGYINKLSMSRRDCRNEGRSITAPFLDLMSKWLP